MNTTTDPLPVTRPRSHGEGPDKETAMKPAAIAYTLLAGFAALLIGSAVLTSFGTGYLSRGYASFAAVITFLILTSPGRSAVTGTTEDA